MPKISHKILRFFFPPSDAPLWVKALPYFVLGVLTFILLTAFAYGWEYTNSPQFCGQTCHTMPPEYTAYLTSPHARIACVDCHIGRGFIATRITRKAGDVKHILATAFQSYDFPIHAKSMRPARETCELCHFPEKFSDDSLREIQRFADDKYNTPYSIYLTLKTGGGSARQGLGRGIHWHIQNKVYYLPLDAEEQQIPFVRVVENDGDVIDYLDIEADFDPQTIRPEALKEMDCITCHNRITHLVPQPEETVDMLLARKLISRQIPQIRQKAIQVYSQIYETAEQGLSGIEALKDYYRVYHPDFYENNQDLLDEAIQALKEAYAQSVFPEQNSNWDSHPNNVGHKYSPGCFRCHDGKHLNAEQQAIRLECNLCHSIPVVAGPYDFVTRIELPRGPEPSSHLNENWIAMHHQAFNATCENCHTTADAGGTSNTSFCSNSACHGVAWKYAGFDAPSLRQVLQAQLPTTPTPPPLPTNGKLSYVASIGALLASRCGACHGENGIAGLNVTTYASLMQGSVHGAVILPGNPQGSLLVQKQSASQAHFGQLTPDELQSVIEWILLGAPEN